MLMPIWLVFLLVALGVYGFVVALNQYKEK